VDFQIDHGLIVVLGCVRMDYKGDTGVLENRYTFVAYHR